MHVGTCLLEQGPSSGHNLLEEGPGVASSLQWTVQLQGESKNSLDLLGFGHATWRGRKPHPCLLEPSCTGRSPTAPLAPCLAAGAADVLSRGFFVSAGEEWA